MNIQIKHCLTKLKNVKKWDLHLLTDKTKMETTEFVTVFQNFGFPIALVIVLLGAMGWIAKKAWEYVKKRDDEAVRLRDQFIAYLQQNHVELTGAILENATAAKENATALKENAAALNRFAMMVEKFEKYLKTEK